jgi:beta-mannanase
MVHAIVKALRDSGRPVLLRVGYEFDAEICPGGYGKYPMAAYQQAFKRVHDIVSEEHADRVALVWNAWAFQARDPGKAVGVAPWGWYPGDDAVDWIGISVFPGFAAGDITEQFQTDKRRQLAEFAKQHGKPLMIAESTPRARFAPALGDVAWNGWYSGVFDYIQQSDAKAFSYINMNWEALPMWHGQGWGDTRVQGSPVAQKWQAALSSDRFVTSSSQLYQELGL